MKRLKLIDYLTKYVPPLTREQITEIAKQAEAIIKAEIAEAEAQKLTK